MPAVMARAPNAAVVAWLDRQETLTLFLSSFTVAEIRYGLQVLPDGRRRSSLEDRFARFLAEGSPAGFSRSTRKLRSATERSWPRDEVPADR